jgi:hypothetical protein
MLVVHDAVLPFHYRYLHLKGDLARLRFISQNFLPNLCGNFHLIAWVGS